MSDQASSKNQIGLAKQDYTGAPSTLCSGCGHDSITNHIITAYYQSGIAPHTVAKMSGIGCSSKTPAYFLSKAHGFNSIHGRMAAVSLGAKVANHTLNVIGISGDGDTASIGVGGFIHLLRRNLPMVYIVENNGVYGLTKGQFSATADYHSTQKSGELNPFTSLDLCTLAIEAGCTFVARSFSGDGKQLVPLIAAAIRHPGTALIDVISPCVTFANHDGSTKSYTYVRDHKRSLQELGFIQPQQEIKIEMEEGTYQDVSLHDGSILRLRKLDSSQHDLTDSMSALEILHEARNKGEILTGLFYLNQKQPSLIETLNLSEKPLSNLETKELRPTPEQLRELMDEFR